MSRPWAAVTSFVLWSSSLALAQNNAEMRVGMGLSAGRVVIASTGNVTVKVRGSITIGTSGRIDQQGGVVQLSGNLTVNGPYSGTGGTLVLRSDGTNQTDPNPDQIITAGFAGLATFNAVSVEADAPGPNKVELAAGKTVTVNQYLSIAPLAEFAVRGGATLQMGPNGSIQVLSLAGGAPSSNGVLRLEGDPSNYAVVTSQNSTVRYNIVVNGDLSARYFRIVNLNTNGVMFKQAGTTYPRPAIRALNSGEFDLPAPNGTFLRFDTIDSINAGQIAIGSDPNIGYGLIFKNPANVAGATSVTLADGDPGVGVLTTNFVNSDGTPYDNDNDPVNNNILLFFRCSGELAGEEHDSEPSSGITPAEAPGRIQWQDFGVRVLTSTETVKFRAPTISRALSSVSNLAWNDIVEPEYNGIFNESVSIPNVAGLRLRYFLINGSVNTALGNGQTLFNCVIKGHVGNTSSVPKVFNCTVDGNVTAGSVKNCLVSGTITATTVASNIASAVLANFCVDPSNWDYHLKTGVLPPASDGVDEGTDLVASGDLPAGWNVDFERRGRTGTWDVGADEYNGGVAATWVTFVSGSVQNEAGVTIQSAFTSSQIVRFRPFGSAPGVSGSRYALVIGRQANKGYLFHYRLDTNQVEYAYKLAGAPYEVYYLNAHKPPDQNVWHLMVLVTVDTNFDGYADAIQILRDYGSQSYLDALTDNTTANDGIIGVRDLNDDGVVDLSTADLNGDTKRDLIVPNCIANTVMAQGTNPDALIRPGGSLSGRMRAVRFIQRFGESDSAPLETTTKVAGQRLWTVVDNTFYKINIDYYDTNEISLNQEFGAVIGFIGPSAGSLDWESDFAVNFASGAGAFVGMANATGTSKLVWRGSFYDIPVQLATWDGNVPNARNSLGMHIEAQFTGAYVYAVSSNTPQALKISSSDSTGSVTWNTNGVNTVPPSTDLLGGRVPTTKFFKVWASNAVLGAAEDQIFKLLDNGSSVSRDMDWGSMMGTVYSAGTVAVTNGSMTVTGTGTSWTSAMVGSFFKINGSSTVYRVASVTTPTSLSLTTPYSGSTGSGLAYRISTPCIGKIVDLTWNGSTVYWVTDQGFAYAANFVSSSGGVDDETLRANYPYLLPGKTVRSMWIVPVGGGASVYFQTNEGKMARLPLEP